MAFSMPQNALRARLHQGQAAFGIYVAIPSPTVIELAGLAGFDFVRIDWTHAPLDLLAIENLVRAAECHAVTPLVRVNLDEQKIASVLELGAMGIIVPGVSTGDAARAAVAAAKFSPIGERGMFSAARITGYGDVDAATYREWTNREVLIGVQIEPAVGILNDIWGAGIDAGALTVGYTPWIVGLIAAIGLFVGVVCHELGHSLTAQRYGFPIESITLWLFGGIAALSEMPENWRQELTIALAGPIVSVLVGIVSYAAFVVTPESFYSARFILGYLAILNVALAVFNMVPAFPMDGGRVLRALLARSQPYAKATQQAAGVGKFFAILMGLFGLLAWNVILIGIALFVYIGASSESQQVTMKAAFEGVTVADIMTPAGELHTVSPETSVAELLQRMFSERHTGYPVLEDGHLVGLVTLSDAREIKPVERDAYRVEEVMTTDLMTITPHADAMDALETMQRERIGRLLVVDKLNVRPSDEWGAQARDDEGDLVGIISRSDLMTALDIIQKSGAVDPSRQMHPAD